MSKPPDATHDVAPTPRVAACLRDAPRHILAEPGQVILVTPAPQLLDLAKQLERELAGMREMIGNLHETCREYEARLQARDDAARSEIPRIVAAEMTEEEIKALFVLRPGPITFVPSVNEKMREALAWIASQERYTFAECSLAEEIIGRARNALDDAVPSATRLSQVGTFTMVGLDTIKFEREDDADAVMNAILNAQRTR